MRFVQVIIMPGIKSDYETEYNRQEDEQNFITAVEFSPQHPYGKAVALFNLKSGFLEVLYPASRKYTLYTHIK